MPRGRPVKSEIRQNIVEILYFIKKGYGYNIYRIYKEIFPKVTMRSIYYHLKKGMQTGEIQIEKVKIEKGEYSWGNEAEKVYYEIGKKAEPKIDERVKAYLEKKK